MRQMRSLLLVLFLFNFVTALGQKGYRLEFLGEDYKQIVKKPKLEFKDSLSAAKYLQSFQNEGIKKGFLLTSIDSIHYQKRYAEVYVHVGEHFNEATIHVSSEEMKFIRKYSSVNERVLASLPIQPVEISRFINKIQNTYLNNGYPFVKLKFDEVQLIGGNMDCRLKIERGPFYQWTKIHVKGDSTVSEQYISSLIQIKKGDVFDESLLKEITNKINQVSFIEEVKPHELLFTPKGVELFVYVKSIPISSVNGIIGFQPDPNSTRLSVTGELNLKLLNVLHRGELLDIKWQSIRDQTQSLNSRLNYPFLFKTSFGIDGSFNLYKRDTSFLELNSSIGVQYFLNQGSYIKGFYTRISSSVLSGGQNNPTFNKLGSTSSNNYGLSFYRQQLDYLPNPSRGLELNFSGSVGTRNSQVNDTALVVRSAVYRSELTINYYIPITRRHVIRLGSNTELYSADEIFENEVFRFGGQNSQRGFNEDELFASSRTTGTIEYRFLLDRNSHVFAFYDQTWYENLSANYYNDTPFGFGVGFAFSTNLGVFSISYALGKQYDNAILISNSKVHFGYIAYF